MSRLDFGEVVFALARVGAACESDDTSANPSAGKWQNRRRGTG